MRHSKGATLGVPVRVDKQVLTGLSDVFDTFERIAKRSLSNKFGVSSAIVERIAAGEHIDEMPLRDVLAIRDSLVRITRPSFEVYYPSAHSFSTSSLKDLISELERDPNLPGRIEVRVGDYNEPTLRISFGAIMGSVSYTATGNEEEAIAISAKVARLIETATISPKWPYNEWLRFLVSAFLGFSTSVYIVWIAANLKRAGFPVIYDIAIEGIVFVGIMVAVSISIVQFADKNFPVLQFDFGASSRRRKAWIGGLMWLLTAILLPIAINLLTAGA